MRFRDRHKPRINGDIQSDGIKRKSAWALSLPGDQRTHYIHTRTWKLDRLVGKKKEREKKKKKKKNVWVTVRKKSHLSKVRSILVFLFISILKSTTSPIWMAAKNSQLKCWTKWSTPQAQPNFHPHIPKSRDEVKLTMKYNLQLLGPTIVS